MQPQQLRIGREIADLHEIGRIVLAIEDPADMAVQEAALTRRMHVQLGVGMQMMVAMLGGPPQHALLGSALRKAGQNELKHPAGGKSLMREIAVVALSLKR